MSIGKSQALALADNFLDSIGQGKGDLHPRETVSELILLAAELIEDAQNNLIESNSVASGGLTKSMEAGDPSSMGSVTKIDIFMAPYGLFVNSGVKGTRGGSSTAGYSFKKDFPSRDFVNSIIAWQKSGKNKTTSVKRTYGAHEHKSRSIGKDSGAFAIARSIMQRGLKPTGFLDKAITTTEQKIEYRLGTALEVDIITSITQR